MAGLGPLKNRRCRFFDRQGNRIFRNNEHGCSRSASNCHFVHPSDPEWSTLPPDPDSDPILVPRSDYKRPAGNSSPRRYSPPPSTSHHGRDRRPSPPIDRRRGSSDSSPKRRRSPSRGSSAHHSDQSSIVLPRSPRRDASPPRRHTSSNVTRDGRPPRRSPSPSRSFSYKRPYSDRQPDPVPKASEKPLPSSMGPGARSSQKETMPPPVRSLRSRTATISSTATGSTASKSSSGTPSTRTQPGPASVSSRPLSEVLPPPPSLNLAPRKDETTPEQRRAAWQKRITLMADATQEYIDLGKLERDVQSRRRQVQSPAFDALPSDVKTTFQTSLRNAEATYERKMGSLNSAIGKLSETDFWPPVPSQKIGDVEAKLKEAKTLLGGLADNVGQLYKRIERLYGQHSTGGSGPSSSGAKAASSGDGDTRAKKRRRLSDSDDDDEDDDDDGIADVPTVAAAPAPPDVREDVESIKDIIREIEDRLQEVENDMTQHSRHIVEQLETTMDEKIEELARSADIAALVEAQLAPRTAQTIRVFDESLAHTDREIAELAQEMAELVPRLAELQRDNDLVKQEEVAEKELLAQLVKADQDNAQAIAHLQEEARTLRSALTAAHSKRALPPAPAMPPSGTFLEALKGSIAKQVQEQIAPIVAQTRTEIERIAKTRDAELYEKLRDRLEQSSKMSQLISTWIERDPDDARRVLAAAAATAQNGGAGGSGSALT